MIQRQLTGTRIRERRIRITMKQAELAAEAGISASYLNLIEHNRRRIGGKLLVRIAQVLGVEPALLSEGVEATLIATLREVRAVAKDAGAEVDAIEEFAGRFPGWAALMVERQHRVATLERTVEALTDRLAHDPHLAASLHEMLSTVTSIRSTAAILADTRGLEPEWRDRFHRNLNEDSARLTRSSQFLVSYLDGPQSENSAVAVSPQEELEAFLTAHAFHFPSLEGTSEDVFVVVPEAEALSSGGARGLARQWLERYQRDALMAPLARIEGQIAQSGADLMALAQAMNVDLAVMMRRMACLPFDLVGRQVGLVSCDAAGAIVFRKPIDGFDLPRYGAACPLWPMFSALSRPMVPIADIVQQPGRDEAAFDCIAVALPVGAMAIGRAPLFEAHMLVMPTIERPRGPVRSVGVSCRICPVSDCAGRREMSILSEEL